MSLVQFVLLLFALFSTLSLISVVSSLWRGRRRSAFRTLRLYLFVFALYGVFLLATTFALPLQVIPQNDPQHAGDWSIAVSSVRRLPHDLDETYEIDFRLSNRGNHVLRGDKTLIVYLLGDDGTRYNPLSQPSTPPFDVPVPPGKFVATTRNFVLPTNLSRVQLVVKRDGFQLDWFVIGRTPLDGHTLVTIQ
jgi:hypothetical protein